jgi:hypothetical protein
MRQLKFFIGRPLDKLSQDLLALDRKQFRWVTGLLTGHYTLRWHLHIMGLSENSKSRKCGQEEESSYHISYSVNTQQWLGIDQRSLALHD